MKRLTVFTGPMAAGKSSRAIIMLERLQRRGLRVIGVRPGCSVRDFERAGGELRTRTGAKFPCMGLISVRSFAQCEGLVGENDVIWIDEPGLFDDAKDLYAAVGWMREHAEVIISGLTMTSECKPFSMDISGRCPVAAVLATADEIITCRADCDFCEAGRDAATRTVFFASDDKAERRVGGDEAYAPACVDCWNRLNDLSAEEKRAALVVRRDFAIGDEHG